MKYLLKLPGIHLSQGSVARQVGGNHGGLQEAARNLQAGKSVRLFDFSWIKF